MVFIMKYAIILTAIIISALCCKKDCECDFFKTDLDLQPLYHIPSPYVCTATKEVPCLGQIPWTANGGVTYRGGAYVSLGFEKYNNPDWLNLREAVEFYNVPFKEGRYYSHPGNPYDSTIFFANYSRVISDGDIFDGNWKTDPDKQSWLQIDKIDWDKKEVEGKYDMYFKMTEQAHWSKHSELINFKSGSFKVSITIR